MKYVLVDQDDDIVDRVELTSNIGVSGARTFFIGRKQIDAKEFDKLWRVMTEESYMWIKKHIRENKYEEFGDWLDIEKS
jgi:hypothetical protein